MQEEIYNFLKIPFLLIFLAVKFEDGTIILPFVDVSFAVGAGAFVKSDKNNSGGAMTGKMSPSSVLVIQNGHTRLVNPYHF